MTLLVKKDLLLFIKKSGKRGRVCCVKKKKKFGQGKES